MGLASRFQKEPLLAPSLLAADFSVLKTEMKTCLQAGVQWLHWDIMDGHFVSNLSMGPAVVSSLRKHTQAFFDVHLMVEEPQMWVEPFAQAGAQSLTFHLESKAKKGAFHTKENIQKCLKETKKRGLFCALAIRPETEVQLLEPYLKEIDFVLLMSVRPGFSGQGFLSSVLEKLPYLVQKQKEFSFWIQMDGGLGGKVVEQVVAQGVQVVVGGASVFQKASMTKALSELFQYLELGKQKRLHNSGNT